MNWGDLFTLALASIAAAGIQSANAGSAVAFAGHGRWYTAYGGPVAREEQRALEGLRKKYGAEGRIIAATDVPGYGAIAVGGYPKGHGSIIGVVLGKRSATEADTMAIEKCLKAGAINPKVRWGFRG